MLIAGSYVIGGFSLCLWLLLFFPFPGMDAIDGRDRKPTSAASAEIRRLRDTHAAESRNGVRIQRECERLEGLLFVSAPACHQFVLDRSLCDMVQPAPRAPA